MAALSCDDCCRWLVNEDWTFATRNGSEGPVRQSRLPLPAALGGGVVTPCGRCPKIPREVGVAGRHPASGRRYGPSERSLRVIRHYLQCRAVGRFPEDSLVRRNAWLLSEVERAFGDAQRRREVQTILTAVGLVAASRE